MMVSRGARSLWLSFAIVAMASSARAEASASGVAMTGPVNHVRDVRVHAGDASAGTEIDVVGTAAPVFLARTEASGRRLVIDLQGADVVGAPEAITGVTGLSAGILTRAFSTEQGSMTRVTINFAKDATYRVRPDGTTLRITLYSAAPGASGASTLGPSPAEAQEKGAAKTGPSAALSEVRFERTAETTQARGQDRVVIEVSPMPSYALTTTASGRVRLELRGTKVPDALLRTLDVTAYHGLVRTVSTFVDAQSGAAIVEIDRSGADQGDVTVEGDKLVWSFDAPRAAPVASPVGGGVSHVRTVAREEEPKGLLRVLSSIHESNGDGVEEQKTGGGEAGFSSAMAEQAGRYTGRRIDLDLKDADIHNILRFLADIGRVNIVTADDVSGNITIRMRNVPWDQALDVVLQAKSLGMVRQGNLIRVAPMAVLQKERELELARHKQELDLAPLETRLIPVSYASAEELQARAKDMLSPRGSIAVDPRTNVLIARDVAGNLNHVEELVRALDTQTPQVLVEARIVEATSKYLRDVGIQWGGDATFSEATGNPTGIAFPSRVGLSGGNYDQSTPTAGLSPFQRQIANPNFAVNLPAAVGTGQGGALGFSLGSVDNNININVRLSAAESSGMVRIVSSPRVLTLDNREARIAQGTLIPFSQVSAQGVQTTFQEAKLQLLVRPHVTADGSVSMHVKINRDEPDFTQTSARGDPTILKREAETDLLVMDGHTAVIGGIYTRNTGRNLDQVPFFGDIPILGVLFQRRRASDERNELVIFLTPRIVNRAESLGR
ncbi:MAG TPA: type IV pilus secretin PilQ [Polyangiaceae bacterium]|nr:type IV pilus secretin PilQ [Polyangiaceae bacterium]